MQEDHGGRGVSMSPPYEIKSKKGKWEIFQAFLGLFCGKVRNVIYCAGAAAMLFPSFEDFTGAGERDG